MVKHWFNCKVSSRSLDSEGAEIKKVEQFVLDAYTYTEAETRMTQICEYEGIRPFEITQLTKTNLIEVIRYPECDKWFRVKVAMTTFDADRGTEKESNQHILLSATDVRDAYDKVSQHMNQLGVGYVIPSIAFQKNHRSLPARRMADGRRPGATQRRQPSIRRCPHRQRKGSFRSRRGLSQHIQLHALS